MKFTLKWKSKSEKNIKLSWIFDEMLLLLRWNTIFFNISIQLHLNKMWKFKIVLNKIILVYKICIWENIPRLGKPILRLGRFQVWAQQIYLLQNTTYVNACACHVQYNIPCVVPSIGYDYCCKIFLTTDRLINSLYN